MSVRGNAWIGISSSSFCTSSSAICWVGGGVILFFAGLMADRRKDDAGTSSVLKLVVILSPIWFIPMSLLTLIFGLIMAFGYNLWSEAWIILGLLGFLTTFCIGLFILKPTSEKFTAHYDAGVAERRPRHEDADVSKFDYVLLFTVIFDMVSTELERHRSARHHRDRDHRRCCCSSCRHSSRTQAAA